MWEVFEVIAEGAGYSVWGGDYCVGEIGWEKDWGETLIITVIRK